ncbi:hypothetical protein EK0264_02875 [Epidermidibacterium keratini]|uniref:DUF8017 domain-containing protein n=1 Tax=Epidermidibacterium keratini TaxID=1891644 RepID=A0A7L4YJR2_9ACTN|nr:hypothetical protein [Epidermidibacterium keratini]QHB99331.1 hypothetical protein EK0264_02875 [Epidermidibacterium keratini]
MTSPAPRSRLFTGPMLAAVGVIVALAIAVVVVLVTRDPSGSEASASSSGTAPATYSKPDGWETVTGYGLSWDYPKSADPFESAKWSNPQDGTVQSISLEGFIGYPTCDKSSGKELTAATLALEVDDPKEGANSAMTTTGGIVLQAGDEYSLSSYSNDDVEDYTTASGLKGGRLTATLTIPEADACGTTQYAITTFATKNASGEPVALIIVHRMDGELLASENELSDIAETMAFSLREE